MVFFVDPMSEGNLERYDLNLLINIKNYEIQFYGNIGMKNPLKNSSLIYHYNKKKSIFFKVLSYLTSQLKLLKSAKKFKPYIIHFQWLKIPHIDYLLLKVMKKHKINIIFTAHDKLPHNSGSKYKKIYKKIYNIVDKIIVHSQNTKEELIEEFNLDEKKIEVIPHGIIKIFNQKNILEDIKDKLEKNKIKLAFLGNICNYKGIDFLVDTWIELEKRHENLNLELIIAGKGDIPKIKELRRCKSVFVDNKLLSDEEFYTYLKLADIILLPYKEISQSGLLSNALAEKKLIIATDKGGIGEPYKLFKLGWLITGENVSEELLKIFEEINQNPYIVNEKGIGISEWQKIEEYYSWERIAKLTETVYSEVINAIRE